MSKHVLISGCVCLLIFILCSWSVFLDDISFAKRIIGIPPPDSIRDISSIRLGHNAPLIQWKMDAKAFNKYKEKLSKSGFLTWNKQHYDSNESTSLYSKALVGGYPKGIGGIVEIGDNIQIPGKRSSHVFYDHQTGEFIAIKGYGTSRFPAD